MDSTGIGSWGKDDEPSEDFLVAQCGGDVGFDASNRSHGFEERGQDMEQA